MSKVHGKKSVVAALLGNTFVTIIKVIAASLTASPSMFAESVHSLADTLNQSLLLIGLNRSKRPADKFRGYGYGIERFFWSLISACGILFIGSGITVYHSLQSLIHPAGLSEHSVNYSSIIVLIISLVVESVTLYLALKELMKGRSFSKKIFKDSDPVTLAVVYEDGAAVLGVLIALAAQVTSYFTGNGMIDALGGLFIGIVLGILAILLITKNYQYILGKSIDEDTKQDIIRLLVEEPCIEKVIEFKSVAVDVGKYRIFVAVEWNGTPLYEDIYDSGELKEEFNNVRDDIQEFTKLMFKTIDRVPRLVGRTIDSIEARIVKQFPQVMYVDIEIN